MIIVVAVVIVMIIIIMIIIIIVMTRLNPGFRDLNARLGPCFS